MFKKFITIAIVILALTISSAFSRDLKGSKNEVFKNLYLPTKSLNTNWANLIFLVGVHQTGMVNASFDNYGNFGYKLRGLVIDPLFPTASFESPPESKKEYLYGGSIWVGAIVGRDTLVSTGADGYYSDGYELNPDEYPFGYMTIFNSVSDLAFRAEYADTMTNGVRPDASGRPHFPLNIKISNTSHSWHTAKYEDIIIYDMILTNIGEQNLEKAYIGFFMDCDIQDLSSPFSSFYNDISGSFRDKGIVYSIDVDGQPFLDSDYIKKFKIPKIFAFKLLSSSYQFADTNFNWWISGSSDYGPRQEGTPEDPFFDFGTGYMGTPRGDRNKYYMLSHNEWDFDQVYTKRIYETDTTWIVPQTATGFTSGGDTRFLMSYGPFDLAPDSSIRLIYTTFTGDNIHVDHNNSGNLPNRVDTYIENLDFSDMLINSERAMELADLLLNPTNTIGLIKLAYSTFDSAFITWDPYVFSNLDGYVIYIKELDGSKFPYPGIIPPWADDENMYIYDVVGPISEYKIKNLTDNKFYIVKVAMKVNGEIGSANSKVLFSAKEPMETPVIDIKSSFFIKGESLNLKWSATNNLDIDHYNIYKFKNYLEYYKRYNRFYDSGQQNQILAPVDTFEVEGNKYYYYAITPYASLDSGITEFTDIITIDSAFYVVTVVDKFGFESDIEATGMISQKVLNKTIDFLVLTESNSTNISMTRFDSIKVFYENILSNYTYDIKNYYNISTRDRCGIVDRSNTCFKLVNLSQYKYIIIDDEYIEKIFYHTRDQLTSEIKNYLQSGGKLIYFGEFSGLNGLSIYGSNKYWTIAFNNFEQDFFNLDSIYFYDVLHYRSTYDSSPMTDTEFGFNYAKPLDDSYPQIYFDAQREPIFRIPPELWYQETPPSVAAFKFNENAEAIYSYGSKYPETSLLEDEVVGIHTKTDDYETYAFGFHLWYMDYEGARALIDKIYLDGVTTDIVDNVQPILPDKISLSQNYPNPFNPNTIISFELPQKMNVTLEIYNILGRKVTTLVNSEDKAAGVYHIEWDGNNNNGDKISSGIYFYRLTADENIISKKMMLIK